MFGRIQDDLDQVHDSETCPKCKGQLEFDSGSTMEWEKWICRSCHSGFVVDVEMVRDWSTLEEVEY